MKHAWPVTPRNSEVLGHRADTPAWLAWWRERADWDAAYPCRGDVAPLNVPVPDLDAVYRVRPRHKSARLNTSAVRVARIDGVWHWVYPHLKGTPDDPR